MRRLIFIIGGTETLGYFSLQMAEYYMSIGREVFLWDMRKPVKSIEAFENLDNPGDSVLITFNFTGLNAEGQFGRGLVNIWDEYGIEKICIMVDSPVYYYRQLSSDIQNLKPVCIDRYHKAFVEKHYPRYGEVLFMPLAGNRPISSLFAGPGILKPGDLSYVEYNESHFEDFDKWNKRNIPFLFIGNYVPLESLEPSVRKLGPDYKEFIMSIADEMIKNPSETFESVVMDNLRTEFRDCEEDEYLQAAYQMIYIDLYVRNIYRGKIVTALADEGLKIYCTGKDWDKAPCKHPENIIHTGDSVVSLQCLEALSNSKVSLNMMPWFKAGAHDRVFSSMLMGCGLLSDSSEYLDEVITGGKEYFRYDLLSPEETASKAAGIAKSIISEPEKIFEIAGRGRETALKDHLWCHRAELVHEKFMF